MNNNDIKTLINQISYAENCEKVIELLNVLQQKLTTELVGESVLPYYEVIINRINDSMPKTEEYGMPVTTQNYVGKTYLISDIIHNLEYARARLKQKIKREQLYAAIMQVLNDESK